jgi:hypothetical protein
MVATTLALFTLAALGIYQNLTVVLNADSEHARVKGIGNLVLQVVPLGLGCRNLYNAYRGNNRPPGVPAAGPRGRDPQSIAARTEAWGQNQTNGTCRDSAFRFADDAAASGHQVPRIHVFEGPGGRHAVPELAPGGPGNPSTTPLFYSWGRYYNSLAEVAQALGPGWGPKTSCTPSYYQSIRLRGEQVGAPNLVPPAPPLPPPQCDGPECGGAGCNCGR